MEPEWYKSKDPYVLLEGIARLPDGWAGQDTKAFTAEHIERCRIICDAFMLAGLPPRISPSNHQAVRLYWTRKEREMFVPHISPSNEAIHLYWTCKERETHLEIEVPREGVATYAKETEPDYFIEGEVDEEDLQHLIMWVTL